MQLIVIVSSILNTWEHQKESSHKKVEIKHETNYNMANNITTNNTLYMSSQHIDSALPNENDDMDQTPLTLKKIEVEVIKLLEIIILNFFFNIESISSNYVNCSKE